MQTILTGNSWESECDPDSENEHVYTVTISERPTIAYFPIEIDGYTVNSLFDTGASVSCISYSFIQIYYKA